MDNIMDSIIEGKNISKVFGYGKNRTIAVSNADFSFLRGEVVSIVGESGSGKTTLAKIVTGLLKQTEGEIYFKGQLRSLGSHRDRISYWKEVQAIFQDPFSSFNIFFKVETLLRNCVKLVGVNFSEQEALNMMREACGFVNLKYEELAGKYPFELSGGQMQRLMISRIFIMKPDILIADEPTSMIDACSRASILDILMKLREEKRMTIVFITHDIGLAYYVSDRIFIMEKGKIIEVSDAEGLIRNPREDYTRQLLSDVPRLGGRLGDRLYSRLRG